MMKLFEPLCYIAAVIVASVLLGSGSTPAQQPPPQMPGMNIGQSEANNPEVKAFRDANAKMHEAMNAPLRGDADWDFVLNMIPHHQGAIDMARVELQYGKDPELLKLAKDIIAAQKKEIAFMKKMGATSQLI
jgi:uncharacterized protein (DUF305 family)